MDINKILHIAFHEPEIDTPELIHDLKVATKGKPANDETPKSYTYYFKLKNGRGSGSMNSPLSYEKARRSILNTHAYDELEVFNLIH